MKPSASVDACPCGGEWPYLACCGRWHTAEQYLCAPDAEHLMRSRYCAYVLGLNDYLLDTWHPSTRPASLAPTEPGLRWMGLEVRHRTATDPNHASVEFVARSKRGGRAHRLHEVSRFVRERGRWYYVDDELQPTGTS